jgi:NTE family protein
MVAIATFRKELARHKSAVTVALTILLLVVIALILSSCAYPSRNVEIGTLSPDQSYRWRNLQPGDISDTVIIVTASGGGTRAALLELSVLEGMQKVALPQQGKTLADEIDVISSVSGGSVTAGYFALHGSAGFPALETFLRQDGIAAIAWRMLNPVALAKLASHSYERIDPQIDYFDDNLFHQATFQTLLDGRRKPYLILNAADMVEGVPFPFTQRKFDLLCSDLSKMKLATAVAASAAFPVALSPVTLKNYSQCKAQAEAPHWPPLWAQNAAESDWNDNPERVVQGRTEVAYATGSQGAHPKNYIHLLDGGIADNLGIAEPYRLLTTGDADPSILNQIAAGKIKKIIFIMVNSRSAALSKLDAEQATPGMLAMLSGSVDAAIDRSTAGASHRLKTLLDTEYANQATVEEQLNHPEIAQRFREVGANTQFIAIDFDAIADPACRQAYHGIATSWTLEKKDIDGLLVMGQALLGADPQFSKAVAAVGGKMPQLPSVAEACKAL